MKNKIYTEIGYGNESFINTEIEYPDGSEIRQKGFVKMKFKGLYLRFWLGYNVYVISTVNGFSITEKTKKKIKIILGLQGEEF